MESDFAGESGKEACQTMRPFPIQSKGMMKLAVDTFNNLTKPGDPDPHALGPSRLLFGIAFRRTQDTGTILVAPALLIDNSFKATISHIKAVCFVYYCGTARVRAGASSQKLFGQRLIFGITGTKAKSGNDALWVDREQQSKTFKPAQTIAPSYRGLMGQPTRAASFGIACRNSRAVQRLVAKVTARLILEPPNSVDKQGRERVVMAPHQTVELETAELAAMSQAGKKWVQLLLGIPVKIAFAAKSLPLAEQAQSHRLTATQRRVWARTCFWLQVTLAKVIDHEVKFKQKSMSVHEKAPFGEDSFTLRYACSSFN